jgi:sugar/nucleoside kinase (ribokinase family)
MHVAVYGNIIYDQIATLSEPFSYGGSNPVTIVNRLGGIVNFQRATPPSYKTSLVGAIGEDYIADIIRDQLSSRWITFEEGHTSQAMIIVDKFNKSRTGLVNWGVCRDTPLIPIEADYHHFMYLDTISVPNFDHFEGVKSADFCDSNKIDDYYDDIAKLDYLIVSELENGTLLGRKIPVKKAVIVHSPTRSFMMDNGGELIKERSVEVVEGLNVLGAGDYFAAYCVANLLVDANPDFEYIHKSVLDLLRDQS